MPPVHQLLLVLALLPGLLVPGGFGLRRCACSGELRLVLLGAATPCGVRCPERAGTGVDGASPRSCCSGRAAAARHDAGGTATGDRIAGAPERCRCSVTTAGDPSPRLASRTGGFELPPATMPATTLRLLPVVAATGTNAPPPGSRGPPPPGAQRNLPLLV